MLWIMIGSIRRDVLDNDANMVGVGFDLSIMGKSLIE